jgi:hypothetical protein
MIGIANDPQYRANASLKRWKAVVIIISLLLLLLSFTQPAYCIDHSDDPWANSFLVFIIGWLGICIGPAVSWLANPLLILTYFLFAAKPKYAFITGILSFAAALSFLCFSNIMCDEAGHFAKITGYGSGYWLWVCSTFTAAAGSGIVYFKTINNMVK